MAELLSVPPGEWRFADAAGYPVRITNIDGTLLFRASDIAAAGGVCVATAARFAGSRLKTPFTYRASPWVSAHKAAQSRS